MFCILIQKSSDVFCVFFCFLCLGRKIIHPDCECDQNRWMSATECIVFKYPPTQFMFDHMNTLKVVKHHTTEQEEVCTMDTGQLQLVRTVQAASSSVGIGIINPQMNQSGRTSMRRSDGKELFVLITKSDVLYVWNNSSVGENLAEPFSCQQLFRIFNEESCRENEKLFVGKEFLHVGRNELKMPLATPVSRLSECASKPFSF